MQHCLVLGYNMKLPVNFQLVFGNFRGFFEKLKYFIETIR